MPNNAYFDKVKLLDGSIAEVRDSVARAAIQGGTYFLGVTSTALTDGSTATQVVIGEATKDVVNGNMVVYGNKEFVYAAADSKWHELGDVTNLGAMAMADTATAVYTPAGTVSAPDITVTPTTVNIKELDVAGSVTEGTANVPTAVNVTAGKANVPTVVEVTPGKAGTPTGVTLPTLQTTLNGDTLELSWTAGSVTPGTSAVPTAVAVTPGTAAVPTVVAVTPGTAAVMPAVTLPTFKQTTVMTGATAALDNAPVFNGTQATIVSSPANA